MLKKLSVPVIYTSHHTYHQQYTYMQGQGWKRMLYFTEKQTYNLAKKIICVSDDTQKDILDHYNVPEENTIVITNGVDIG